MTGRTRIELWKKAGNIMEPLLVDYRSISVILCKVERPIFKHKPYVLSHQLWYMLATPHVFLECRTNVRRQFN